MESGTTNARTQFTVVGLGAALILVASCARPSSKLPAPQGGAATAGAESNESPEQRSERRSRELNLQVVQLMSQERYSEAVPIAQHALEITESLHTKPHPNLSADLVTLASLYQKLGDYFNSESLVLRAVDVDTQLHGRNHPETAVDLALLARAQEEKGDAGAEQTYLQAVSILRSSLDQQQYVDYYGKAVDAYTDFLRRKKRFSDAIKALSEAEQILETADPGLAVRMLESLAEISGELQDHVSVAKWNARAHELKQIMAKSPGGVTIIAK
jgi:tetratricopeptide (TPR) repeat protein